MVTIYVRSGELNVSQKSKIRSINKNLDKSFKYCLELSSDNDLRNFKDFRELANLIGRHRIIIES